MPLEPAIRWFSWEALADLDERNNLQTKKTSAKHPRKCQGNKRNMTRTETFLTPTFSVMDFCGFRAVSEWFQTSLGGLADLDGRNNLHSEKSRTQHTRKCQTARCIFQQYEFWHDPTLFTRTCASRMAHRLRQTSIIFRHVEFLWHTDGQSGLILKQATQIHLFTMRLIDNC